MPILRKAELSDLDEVMRLEHAGFSKPTWEARKTFEARLATFNDGFWVMADPSGRLHGYLCAEVWRFAPEWNPKQFTLNHSASETHVPDGDEVYVSSMTVDAASRGQGFGRLMFNGALAAMFKSYPALASTILMVNEDWIHARIIYDSVGFVTIGSMDQYFRSDSGKPQRAIIMRRLGRTPGDT